MGASESSEEEQSEDSDEYSDDSEQEEHELCSDGEGDEGEDTTIVFRHPKHRWKSSGAIDGANDVSTWTSLVAAAATAATDAP